MQKNLFGIFTVFIIIIQHIPCIQAEFENKKTSKNIFNKVYTILQFYLPYLNNTYSQFDFCCKNKKQMPFITE